MQKAAVIANANHDAMAEARDNEGSNLGFIDSPNLLSRRVYLSESNYRFPDVSTFPGRNVDKPAASLRIDTKIGRFSLLPKREH